ncbi:MAG TPA: carboxypeptidase regulatory-like domain-containing protein [Rhodothermales bacterium]|nr:carboxypeptidase regulatory-like domain-containing protein [Rhodothermales bacterium]
MRLLALVVLLLPFSAAAQGAGMIYGRVVDDRGVGVAGVRVVLDGTPYAAVSREGGHYGLPGIPAGTYLMTVQGETREPETFYAFYLGSGHAFAFDPVVSYGFGCCLGCIVNIVEPPLFDALSYSPRRVRPDDLALLAYR